MAGGKSAYLEAAQLQAALGGVAWTPPTTVYFALSLAAYDKTATGSTLTEPADTYVRVSHVNDSTLFSTPTGSNPTKVQLAAAITFATAVADWGTVLSAYVVDAASGGNVLYGADASSPIPVTAGLAPVISAFSWSFTED